MHTSIQQGVAAHAVEGRDLPSLNILTKGNGRRLPFTAGLSCNQVPPSVCFSASYLSSCIVSIKIAVGGG